MSKTEREYIEVDGIGGYMYQRPRKPPKNEPGKKLPPVWYLDINDPSGRRRYLATRSLGTSVKGRAKDEARRILRSKQVMASDGTIEYLETFWSPESRRMRALKSAGRAPHEERMVRMRSNMNRHVIPFLRSQNVHRLGDLTYAVAQDLINDLSDKLAPGTVAHIRGAVSQALQEAVRENIIASNVMRETERPSYPRQSREHIPWPQLKEILKPGYWSSHKAYTGALLASSTAMRTGELRGLLWRHVDTERGVIDVVHSLREYDYGLKPPKNGKPRYGLRLPAMVVQELAKMKPADVKPDSFVFTRPDGVTPVAHNFFLYHLRQAAKRAGEDLTDKQTFHSLRHSAVSYGLSGGQDRARREALLQMAGHADEGIQGIYSHVTEAQLDAIAAEWDDRFSQIG